MRSIKATLFFFPSTFNMQSVLLSKSSLRACQCKVLNLKRCKGGVKLSYRFYSKIHALESVITKCRKYGTTVTIRTSLQIWWTDKKFKDQVGSQEAQSSIKGAGLWRFLWKKNIRVLQTCKKSSKYILENVSWSMGTTVEHRRLNCNIYVWCKHITAHEQKSIEWWWQQHHAPGQLFLSGNQRFPSSSKYQSSLAWRPQVESWRGRWISPFSTTTKHSSK